MYRYAQQVLGCLAAQPCAKTLSDHSALPGNWHGAALWIGKQYFERLAAQVVHCFAWVYSFGPTDQLTMEKALLYPVRPVVAMFGEVASAYGRLRRCPAPDSG